MASPPPPPLLLLFHLLLLAVRCKDRIRNHKTRHLGSTSSSFSSLILLLLLLLFPLLLAVRWIVSVSHHKMRQVGIIPLGRILIIETNAEQMRTNTFLVLQLKTFDRMWFAVIILSALVSSCAYGRCFFAANSTTDLHTGVGVWVGGGACVWGGGGEGSRYLGCVSGGVAKVISLGIRSSLGFRFRIRFRVGIRCCTPDTHPGCCGPARAPALARAPRAGV